MAVKRLIVLHYSVIDIVRAFVIIKPIRVFKQNHTRVTDEA